ncbi:MAG TPA: hypothetical protein VJQ83_05375 [Tepidiformaceae bacterium]|nr:hypothetical protein [Tepidiformaceae bacterium]
MLLRLSALAMAGIVLLGVAACSSARTYSTTRADKDYDLAAMALTEQEMPGGLAPAVLNQHEYNNTDWVATLRNAQIIDPSGNQDTQTKQLDSEGRVRNWVSVYSPASLGRIIGVTTVSTLFKTANDANKAMNGELCGLPVSTSQQTAPLSVPKLADASTGFQTVAQGGLVDSTLCIRTGRIIHAIQEASVPGTEDFAALVQMGQDMVTRVNGVFDGKIKGTPVPTPSPSATPSATTTGSATPTGSATATGSETPTPPPSTSPAASGTPGG